MAKGIAVCVLGNRNSGKSHTWNTLFGRTVRTGSELRKLYFDDGEYVEVFLVSGSPEERQSYVGDIISVGDARIVLCSMQYKGDVLQTIKYFSENNYLLFVHWLNPGYSDSAQEFDTLGLVSQLLAHDALIGLRNGKVDAASRVREIRSFIYGWAHDRNLVKHA